MKLTRKLALAALLVPGALSLTGCASDYYYHDYGQVIIIDDGPICRWPVPYEEPPYGGPIVVAEEHPRSQPLPKPVAKPAPRTKEPPQQPRTPAPRTPKPRGGGTRATKSGEVRR